MLGTMTYEEARNCASSMTTSANNMDEYFSRLRSEMNSLEDVLKSKGADDLYNTFLELDKKLDGFPEKIREFSKFLTETVDAYIADDENLSNMANS